ncbi:NUDIX domain-containing protein [Candidatus Alkanophaga liquidiphilum]
MGGQIVVAVGAVIKDRRGRILLVRHVPEHKSFWSGKWICPGGRLKLGESIEDGILREVAEETHLHIKLTRPLIPFERIVKENDETKLHVIYIDYLAEVVGGELKPDDDVGEALWASKEDILRLWDELHEDTKKLLKIAGVVD